MVNTLMSFKKWLVGDNQKSTLKENVFNFLVKFECSTKVFRPRTVLKSNIWKPNGLIYKFFNEILKTREKN